MKYLEPWVQTAGKRTARPAKVQGETGRAARKLIEICKGLNHAGSENSLQSAVANADRFYFGAILTRSNGERALRVASCCTPHVN